MKTLSLCKSIIAAVLVLSGCCHKAQDPEAASAKALANRILPSHKNDFRFERISDSTDVFILSSENGKIVIQGNNANSMATGLNHYLKYYCKREVSWFNYEHFTLPSKLPRIPEPVRVEARVKDRFFLNYCTFGYTMPWWKWDQWERFIDWMALNGVNMALAITGQESIWYDIWREMGMTDEQIRSYFSGPAHLPWHRMINMDGWGGPLPASWLDGQAELQKKICERERALGIKPILPAFNGHVPAQLADIYPDAPIKKLAPWEGMSGDYACSFLDPMSALYKDIQKKFIEKQASLYGTSHIYGIDPFNEVTPPSWESDYLARVAEQIYDSISAADPEAVWLQMGWIFSYQRTNWTDENIKAYLGANPAESQLILDYYCENTEVWPFTEKLFGTPYIWCYLGNFGGNSHLCGNLAVIDERFENTLVNGSDNLTGIGCTLEGLDCNPYVYQYVLEKAWSHPQVRDLEAWIDALADQRLGKTDEKGREAWHLFADKFYKRDRPSCWKFQMCFIRPDIDGPRAWTYRQKGLYEDIQNLHDVLSLLLQADGQGDAYAFDLANVSRQLLMTSFSARFWEYETAFKAADKQTMETTASQMLSLLDQLAEVLGTRTYFQLGKWIEDARAWGKDAAEKDYYERNARNLITTWTYNAHYPLNDYARRAYDGLVSTYYKPRWEMFFASDDLEQFRADAFEFETAWWNDTSTSFKREPEGDIREIASRVLQNN